MTLSLLREDQSYTFSDYFTFSNPTRELVAEFSYQFHFQKLDLPQHTFPAGGLERLRQNYYEKLPHITLSSEAAKREFYIAPILLELLDYVDFTIDVEYPLYVTEQLKGSIDYFIRSTQYLLIIEAKNADLERGFSQLAIEMIAVDQQITDDVEFIYGAITVGDIWRFGILQRAERTILKDIDAFRVPADLEALFSVLVGILQPEPQKSSSG